MTENAFSPIEAEAKTFLVGCYPVDHGCASGEFRKQVANSKEVKPEDLIRGLINEAYNVTGLLISPIDQLPESSAHFHLPSFLAAIRDLEGHFGTVDWQLTPAVELDILILAEKGIAKRLGKNAPEPAARSERIATMVKFQEQLRQPLASVNQSA